MREDLKNHKECEETEKELIVVQKRIGENEADDVNANIFKNYLDMYEINTVEKDCNVEVDCVEWWMAIWCYFLVFWTLIVYFRKKIILSRKTRQLEQISDTWDLSVYPLSRFYLQLIESIPILDNALANFTALL